MRKINPTIWVAVIGAIGAIAVAVIQIQPLLPRAGTSGVTPPAGQQQQPQPPPVRAPFHVTSYFYPGGWMGDGEGGIKYVQLDTASGESPRPGDIDGLCIEIGYQPGPSGWAGIFWQYPDRNWGDRPGRAIAGASKVTFWAAGKRGGESVEFKAGGIADPTKPYRDSFEVSLGRVKLTRTWTRYEISLAGQDLSNVIGAFAWVAAANANPGGLTFYLDDIRYE